MNINNRLAEIQKHYKLNNSDFAQTLGISGATLSHIYKGRNNPSLPIFEAIAKHFPDIDLNWLITGSKQMLTSIKTVETNVNINKSPIETYVKNKVDSESPMVDDNAVYSKKEVSSPFIEKSQENEIIQIITVYKSGEYVILTPKK